MNDRVVFSCFICGKQLKPDPRLGDRQRTCGDASCQKQRRCMNSRDWRIKQPEADDPVYRRIRRRDRRDYRRKYWATHPQARRHHAEYMRQWRDRRRLKNPSVRDPYRDTCVKLPDINSYLQVMDVREANRVITVKLLSPQELILATCP